MDIRKQYVDLVEERALELVNDMLIQHSGRLKALYSDEGVLETMYIKGKDYDWKLTNNKYKAGIQMVSTYVWQPKRETVVIGIDEEGVDIREVQLIEPDWKGPICIDNMSEGAPLGDQFAGRALALLNDSFTIKIVNTIKSYLTAEENEYRVDENDMR